MVWCSVYIVCPSVLSCGNLKLHQTLELKNVFKSENVMLQLTFNPGLTLTSFRTTRPRVAVKIQEGILSPGQTDRQVVASGRMLNLRRGFRWVGKRTRTFLRKYTQVAKKTLYADSSISLANNRLIDVTQLALIRVEWPNGENSLALTCVQI